MPKHVVLLSGGLDSTVALALACWRDGPSAVLAVGVSYGQAHINELEYARAAATRFGAAFFVGRLDPAPWKLLPLLTGETVSDRDVYAMRTGGISDAFLPGRNVAFLSLALSVAGVQGAEHIWLGANADDVAGFPDCRAAFFAAWQQMASAALDRRVTLQTPLAGLTKREVAGLARRLGIDLATTWSCYRPVAGVGGAYPCTRCDACRLRAEAIR
jgi:7-cyano-7-deazaguanine synthase